MRGGDGGILRVRLLRHSSHEGEAARVPTAVQAGLADRRPVEKAGLFCDAEEER